VSNDEREAKECNLFHRAHTVQRDIFRVGTKNVPTLPGLTRVIIASTIIHMETRLIWDERLVNIAKHGLDFVDACEVLDSRYRLDIPVIRNGEARTQSFSYTSGFLAVLTVVHTERDGAARVISFRRASEKEWERYDAWLENQ